MRTLINGQPPHLHQQPTPVSSGTLCPLRESTVHIVDHVVCCVAGGQPDQGGVEADVEFAQGWPHPGRGRLVGVQSAASRAGAALEPPRRPSPQQPACTLPYFAFTSIGWAACIFIAAIVVFISPFHFVTPHRTQEAAAREEAVRRPRLPPLRHGHHQPVAHRFPGSLDVRDLPPLGMTQVLLGLPFPSFRQCSVS